MRKIIKDDCNISSSLRYIFQKAILITSDLRLDKVNTCSILLAMIDSKYSVINEIYFLNAIKVDFYTFLSRIVKQKEFYEEIMGLEYPFESLILENNMDLFEEIKDIINEGYNSNSVDETSKTLTNIILNSIEKNIYPDFENIQYNDIQYTDNLKKAIIDAGTRCRSNGKDCIDEENLLYSILNLPDPNCSAKNFIEFITKTLQSSDIDYSIIDMIEDLINNYTIYTVIIKEKIVIPKPLENFCTILNDNYKKGTKCDILGRDNELNELWSILSKKQKSNAILTGEAGVGKSAIVEALTMSIVNGTCPEKFIGFKVVKLDITGMVAGTMYRGEFEKKVEYLIDFINSYDNLIIFVDEMHQLMGAGSAEGSGPDLSGSLKPILARDKIKFIGATTLEEYKKYICRDNAFKRRFELVIVNEPKQSEVLSMLRVKIDNLKKFHGVTINKKVLEYIQLCAACFNTSTCNPDKTLDLIDRAMVSATLAKSKSVKIEHVDKLFNKNYKKYEENSSEVNEETAYHEAGHFVAHILHKKILVDMEVYALSVIPDFGFLGANVLESTDKQPKCDLKYFRAEIASLLSGRIAEEIFFHERGSGASEDLGKATRIARNIVSNYGLSYGNYTNFSIYDYNTGNTLPFSNNVIDNINKEAKEIVDNVYESTKELLSREENKTKIDTVAKILLKKKIVSAKELEEAINKL